MGIADLAPALLVRYNTRHETLVRQVVPCPGCVAERRASRRAPGPGGERADAGRRRECAADRPRADPEGRARGEAPPRLREGDDRHRAAARSRCGGQGRRKGGLRRLRREARRRVVHDHGVRRRGEVLRRGVPRGLRLRRARAGRAPVLACEGRRAECGPPRPHRGAHRQLVGRAVLQAPPELAVRRDRVGRHVQARRLAGPAALRACAAQVVERDEFQLWSDAPGDIPVDAPGQEESSHALLRQPADARDVQGADRGRDRTWRLGGRHSQHARQVHNRLAVGRRGVLLLQTLRRALRPQDGPFGRRVAAPLGALHNAAFRLAEGEVPRLDDRHPAVHQHVRRPGRA